MFLLLLYIAQQHFVPVQPIQEDKVPVFLDGPGSNKAKYIV